MKLTARETVVLGLIAQGLTDREIAIELAISVYTARKHRENLLDKFGFMKSAQLTMRYFILFPDVLKKTVSNAVPTRSRRANARS
ncbi:LuxR C-terminal-related transcriptional regulator [Burkholderia sp. AU30280]|uniref:response regulator transcription factor n=1 Tax=Burkholderia sp. AU30280 TaxID=2879628 RepID=UPI001CF36093|nr:LuxR C-terminal-related transcriptional regulator [Burkholderia sp. AU30280]MCA8271349.1 LuxR C-terminal-related transcriptional regulator [Burkholderia sp. AU30280]